jgi:hypothetical protein
MTFYVMPTDLTDGLWPAGIRYESMSPPGQPTVALVKIEWEGNWRAREALEARPGVVPLGELWDLIPPGAVLVLDAFRVAQDEARVEAKLTLTAAVQVGDTLATALRKALGR